MLKDRIREYAYRADLMEPVHEREDSPRRRSYHWAQSIGVFGLLDLNDHLIGRFQPGTPAIWDTKMWPWIADVEARVPEIREELEAYISTSLPPHVAEVSGYDPDSESGRESIPVSKGAWRTALLFANGAWVEETARHFPVTRSLFKDIHPKANVGFSALEPRSHIHAHVGPNRGALRLQVPIIVPGEHGDCRIRIGDDMVKWREGEAIVFDLKTNHEAWNDTDGIRVLLMVELAQPLPAPLALVNRAAQYSYRWHPSYRQMPERIAQFGRAHDEAAESA